MADLDEIYNTRILELAGGITRSGRLSRPTATGEAVSKLCGSTIVVDIEIEHGVISDFAHIVKACLLGQAATSVVAREIVGETPQAFRSLAAEMRRMLKDGGPPPAGRWADLAVLEPVRHYRARHASTLLVFDAVERALDAAEAKAARAEHPTLA
jgi:NifU-like protein involved in Fe-S cluster formation